MVARRIIADKTFGIGYNNYRLPWIRGADAVFYQPPVPRIWRFKARDIMGLLLIRPVTERELFCLTTVPKRGQKGTFKFKSRGLRPGDGKMNRYSARISSTRFGGELYSTGSDSRAFLIVSIFPKLSRGGTCVSGESVHFLLAKLSP
jgi:hypothetical protein